MSWPSFEPAGSDPISSWKNAVRAQSLIADLPAHGGTGTGVLQFGPASLLIDDVNVAIGDRILIGGDVASHVDTGIYYVSGIFSVGDAIFTILTRATDANTAANLLPQSAVRVSEGTLHANTEWVLTTQAPIVVNVTLLAFAAT